MEKANNLSLIDNKKQPNCCWYKFNFFKFFNKNSNIVILRLSGVISASSSKFNNNISLDSLKSSIDEAFNYKRVKSVVLQIDCPGGSPVQSELIYNYIKDLSIEKNIPTISFIEDVAASGGLYLAYISDSVFASNASIIGSIGVRSSGFGFHDAIKKLGIERRIYTQGENKVILDPFLPEKESDIEIINKIQKDIHQEFKDFVKSRRGSKINISDDELFSGEFWSGKKAREIGLIDEIGDCYNIIKKKFGNDINIKKIQIEKSWIKRKFKISSIIDIIFDKFILFIEERFNRNKLGM
jgi:signal peptide peptidase SppA